MSNFDRECEKILEQYQFNEGILGSIGNSLKDMGRSFVQSAKSDLMSAINNSPLGVIKTDKTRQKSGIKLKPQMIQDFENISTNQPQSVKPTSLQDNVTIDNDKVSINKNEVSKINQPGFNIVSIVKPQKSNPESIIQTIAIMDYSNYLPDAPEVTAPGSNEEKYSKIIDNLWSIAGSKINITDIRIINNDRVKKTEVANKILLYFLLNKK